MFYADIIHKERGSVNEKIKFTVRGRLFQVSTHRTSGAISPAL